MPVLGSTSSLNWYFLFRSKFFLNLFQSWSEYASLLAFLSSSLLVSLYRKVFEGERRNCWNGTTFVVPSDVCTFVTFVCLYVFYVLLFICSFVHLYICMFVVSCYVAAFKRGPRFHQPISSKCCIQFHHHFTRWFFENFN